MDHYVTGGVIRALREKKKLTQSVLADRIGVSDKAVSKWETGRGLPDITLLEPLAAALGVSVIELLRGAPVVNRNVSANMRRGALFAARRRMAVRLLQPPRADAQKGVKTHPSAPERPSRKSGKRK